MLRTPVLPIIRLSLGFSHAPALSLGADPPTGDKDPAGRDHSIKRNA